MRAHNRWLKRRAAAPETQAAIWTWQARDRKRRWDINAEAAAEERRLKTPRSAAQEAAAEEEAERRSRTAEARAGAEALESGQRVEGARAARAGKRGIQILPITKDPRNTIRNSTLLSKERKKIIGMHT